MYRSPPLLASTEAGWILLVLINCTIFWMMSFVVVLRLLVIARQVLAEMRRHNPQPSEGALKRVAAGRQVQVGQPRRNVCAQLWKSVLGRPVETQLMENDNADYKEQDSQIQYRGKLLAFPNRRIDSG